MIGSDLKKLAKENGMKIAQGVAYGSLRGYAATLSEGAGYMQVIFSVQFADAGKKAELQSAIEETNLKELYKVKNIGFGKRAVHVIFTDSFGVMRKIRAFIDWFIPLLQKSSASVDGICPECGEQIQSGRWVLRNGVAHHLHDACVEKVQRDIREQEELKKQERTGSYLRGIVGALLGAVLGAIIWAVVLNMGFMAAIVGFLIGWLAEKGYDLLKGKQGKAKIVILIIAVILGVLLGNFCADAFTVAGMIQNGELSGVSYGDIPLFLVMLLTEDAQYSGALLQNVLMGLLFAAIGVFTLLRKTNQEVSKTRVSELP